MFLIDDLKVKVECFHCLFQVKNFGRSGRTKYTHLVDQDTTIGDSPWISETSTNLKFYNNVAGGMRNQFEKPSSKKRKMH
jgi:microfibrillar-associated protein 1